MDPKQLKRNAKAIHDILLETDAGQLITKKPCKIYIPARFAERKLAVIANEIRIVGIFAIVDSNNNYGVSCANAMMQFTPTSTHVVKINGEDNYEFSFEAGSIISPNINLVKKDTLTYNIYDEIIAKGNVPWFFNDVDLCKLFSTSIHHAGVALGPNNIAIELIAASITRRKGDLPKYYRHSLKEGVKFEPAYIPLRSIIYGPTNTTAKLMGSYFEEGMLSSLVNPSQKPESIETLLRS